MNPEKDTHVRFVFKKSFAGIIDIIGFCKRFPNEKDSCIKLISKFAEYNGEHFDQKSTVRQVRPATLSFSDNIGLSIPVEFNPELHDDEFYVPLFSFLHAISFFAYDALCKGFLIRGAITYGEMYHTNAVIAGEPLIEAAKQEKEAFHPKIIITQSALDEIGRFSQHHAYGWSRETLFNNLHLKNDEVDNKTYFDWLGFYKENPKSNMQQSKQAEIINTIQAARVKLEESISKETDVEILQKLYWMDNYLKYHTSHRCQFAADAESL